MTIRQLCQKLETLDPATVVVFRTEVYSASRSIVNRGIFGLRRRGNDIAEITLEQGDDDTRTTVCDVLRHLEDVPEHLAVMFNYEWSGLLILKFEVTSIEEAQEPRSDAPRSEEAQEPGSLLQRGEPPTIIINTTF